MAMVTKSSGAVNESCPQSEESGMQAMRQVWWSFELQALTARFSSALLRYVAGGPGGNALLEVDLSDILGYSPRSVTIIVLVPPEYPHSRPVLVPTDRCGCLDREQLQELTRCTAKSVESAASTNGPSVFFAVDQATSLVRTKFAPTGGCQKTCEQHEEANGQCSNEKRRSQKCGGRSRQKKHVMTAMVPPLPGTPREQISKHQESLCSRSMKARGMESISTSPGNATPSDSLSSSSEDTVFTDSSSSSSSSEEEASDGEMATIAAQLHLNVRRRLLLKKRLNKGSNTAAKELS
eukprot:TRINITY_DN42263_c0_g1_i1.p1 TRINITY_DN42263_c0_g1~~TRINITY_DN42263_c0_g1_i1.p1  ORF type:complete len:294 (+),score=60.80 TRINITY_DN42263_c0_g1_i1:89-970(+)